MKKSAVVISFIAVIILGLIVVYYYLIVNREINIYREYRVYDVEETGGTDWLIIHSEESRRIHMKKFNINIPEVDFSKYYLLWSSGRRIKKITYRLISKYKWRYDVPKGVACFGDKYYPHTAFFYKINKVLVKQDWLRRDELMKKMKEKGNENREKKKDR